MSATSRLLHTAGCLVALLTAGCDDLGLHPGRDTQLSLSVTTTASSGPDLSMAGATADPRLQLSSVQLLLKEIELKRVDDDCEDEGANDDCDGFSAGWALVDLPLSGGWSLRSPRRCPRSVSRAEAEDPRAGRRQRRPRRAGRRR